MIPPIEILQVRPCDDCHCYTTYPYGSNARCRVNPDTEETRRDYIHETVSQDASVKEWARVEMEANKTFPCPYHLTPDEYRELIESGAV